MLRFFFYLWLFALLSSVGAWQLVHAGSGGDSVVRVVSPAAVSGIRSIRGLPDALIKTRPEVTLRGVVTFHDSVSGLTYLEDNDGGIELRGMPNIDTLKQGCRIEVSGHIDEARPIPGIVVENGAVNILGQGALPEAAPLQAEQIRTGELDGRRVTMDATVFSMFLTNERGDPPWIRLNVATPLGHMTWLLPWQKDRPLPTHLLHAKVRCKGVCEGIFNNRGQRIGELLFVGDLDDLAVVRPPLADPFSRPTRSLAELMRPGLDDPYERVRVEGVVLLCQQQAFFNLVHLRTAQGAIQVEIVGKGFDIGDRVAVVGYQVLADKHVVLREAVARKLGHEEPAQPLDYDVKDLLQLGSDSDLVRIQGSVLRNGLDAGKGSLLIDSSSRIIEVVLSAAIDQGQRLKMASELAVGTQLELVGVAELHGIMLITGSVSLTDMRLIVRGPGDIRIVKAAPWWNPRRLLTLAGSLAAVLGLSGAWAFMLRRRVVAQTKIIRNKVERETRWIERSRIARDIHDDVGSALTQITLLGDLGRRGGRDPRQVDDQFERISGQARDAVRALDAIVWTVNPKNDVLAVAVSYLCQMVQELTRDTEIRCRLEVPDELPEISLGAMVRHNLLLAVKEAVHNVIKHSGATVMRLRIDCGADSFCLAVADNGAAFDVTSATSHRTGLDSMRQRMMDIAGTFDLISNTGQGTVVRFELPWSAMR